MAKIDAAVFDAGPLIHLHEVGAIDLVRVISSRLVTPEVVDEAKTVGSLKTLKGVHLDGMGKDYAKLLMAREGIHLGEATSIALCRKERIPLFFTDDLDAREVAKREGLNAHGTLAIVLRNLKEGLIKKQDALKVIRDIQDRSSLYLTSDLVRYLQKEIEVWSKKNST